MKIGIIGGSGLDDPKILDDFKEIKIETPYGETSSAITCGKIQNNEVYILARHGKKHTITPTHINYRANIWALKELGCEAILATTACGSLKEEIQRGDIVILDQFIDFTKQRITTFHENFNEEPKHTPMAEPFNKELRKLLIETAKNLNLVIHENGTVITIEGPRFSTKAESKIFRQWGADVINMSISSEAILSNELGLKYAAIAMSTDYDCWKENEEPVSWEAISQIMKNNAENVKTLILKTIENIR